VDLLSGIVAIPREVIALSRREEYAKLTSINIKKNCAMRILSEMNDKISAERIIKSNSSTQNTANGSVGTCSEVSFVSL